MVMGVDVGAETSTRTGELWPITWMKPLELMPMLVALDQLCQVLADAGVVASLSLVMRSEPGGAISAWLGASSIEATGREVALLRRLVSTSLPFIGLGRPDAQFEAPEGDRGIRFHVAPAEGQNRAVVLESALWSFLASSEHPWQLTVSVSGHGGDGAEDTDIGISLIGSGDEGSIVGSLLVADVLGFHDDLTLVPHYVDGAALEAMRADAATGRAPSAGLVPRRVGMHVLGLVGRVRGSWPVVPAAPVTDREMISLIESAIPPHALIQGGSGLGKTTLLEHLIARDATAGNTVLVICPHGDLARRAATHLSAAGAPTRMVDFGEMQPVLWNLTVPDPGVGSAQHASLLLAVLRRLWARSPDDYFGPVWNRVVRALLTILVADPAGPWPLTRFPELLQLESDLRHSALRRIADPGLTSVIEEELFPMLNARDPGNTVVWLVSKLDLLIGDPTLRSIIDTSISTFPVHGLVEGESLVVAIPETRLTEAGAAVLAGLLVGRVWALVKRHGPGRPIHVYLDEWQRMAVPEIGQLMAEGRKYGIKVRLANQNSAQIPSLLWETATANSGALVSFRMGAHDALRSEVHYPTLDSAQLASLPNHWVAMSAGGADLVAPGPGPLRRDGGLALRAGHKQSVAQTRRALHATIAARLATPKSPLRG